METILAKRDMLAEYFSVHITSDGMVDSLPLLLRDYTPNLDKLPSFLMRLGPQVYTFIACHVIFTDQSVPRLIGRPKLTALAHFFASSLTSTSQAHLFNQQT